MLEGLGDGPSANERDGEHDKGERKGEGREEEERVVGVEVAGSGASRATRNGV